MTESRESSFGSRLHVVLYIANPRCTLTDHACAVLKHFNVALHIAMPCRWRFGNALLQLIVLVALSLA